ncbi:single-stranded DNA-binding protein [Arthrobacter agilis]|uniref:single-stranded DNA-binding protein n=1 Tax=Arthrobacter agilis TaxID=37921 RepID=UPI0023665249|nr:single-stranded DNA-binding protein [Arthrobacter agilis]WDF32052.1 single-stranded DNA-binding protein [Arthrobacter agilis]
MTDIITVRGYVATEVRLTLAQSGLPITGFRMCSTERRFDRESNSWVDGHTNWYSVSMFRQLATNAGASIRKGDRVIVTGRLKVRPWINSDGRTGTSVEIDAETAGHDLMWGTANFKRTTVDRSETSQGAPALDQQGGAEFAAESTVDGGVPDGVDLATGEVYETGQSPEAERAEGAEADGHDDGEQADSSDEEAFDEERVPF